MSTKGYLADIFILFLILMVGGIFNGVSSLQENGRGKIPYKLLQMYGLEKARRGVRDRTYLSGSRELDTLLPRLLTSKRGSSQEDERLRLSWLAKRLAEENDKKEVNIPMRFMFSKRSADLCERAIEVCTKSVSKRSRESNILKLLERELENESGSL